MGKELINITKIGYNSDETVMTVAVNDKPLSRYEFISFPTGFDWEKPSDACCRPCAFFDIADCDEIKCCAFERDDEQSGYYIIVE